MGSSMAVLNELGTHNKIALSWVEAQADNELNEEADKLANGGAKEGPSTGIPACLMTCKKSNWEAL